MTWEDGKWNKPTGGSMGTGGADIDPGDAAEMRAAESQGVDWICNGADWRTGRHAGYSKTGLPARCPYCGAGVRVRTHCACGHPIKECSQSICTSPLARDD
jgi:hypothetical protein